MANIFKKIRKKRRRKKLLAQKENLEHVQAAEKDEEDYHQRLKRHRYAAMR